MLHVTDSIIIPDSEVEITAVRSSGAGGQNVNKVATAVHLRFVISSSSLPEFYKQRLLAMNDKRITRDGVIVIKAQEYRTQEKNREEALKRLCLLIRQAGHIAKRRIATKPSGAVRENRLIAKNLRARKKDLRKRVSGDE